MSSKQHSRRALLKTLAAGTVAVGLGAGLAGGAAAAAASVPGGGRSRLVPLNKLGIILYSVRDKVSSLGFARVFEELSAIGYTQVEFAGYTQGQVGAITVQEIRTLLDDFGLEANGSHVNLNLNNIDAELDKAEILGMKHLGQGGAIASGVTQNAWLTAANNWNIMGEKAAARGIKLYTHNHAGEFQWTTVNGQPTDKRCIDIVLENTNPDWVFFEMDVYWAHVGAHRYPGFRPIDYVLAHPRRFPLLHLKDGKINPNVANGYDWAEFGAGDIDYASFLGATRDRGQRIGNWEQDDASTNPRPGYPADSFGNAARSFEAIAALRG